MSRSEVLALDRRVVDSRAPRVIVEQVAASADPDRRCVLLREPASAQARSYRLLRHRLLAQSDPRIVAVTSARSGEGKTTCAINLALAIAEETFAKVLLLEANPRRPVLASVFGVTAFSASGTERMGVSDGTQRHKVFAFGGTRLHVASAAHCVVESGGLDRMLLHVAVRELREAYDHLVTDTAAALESADADVVCECADGVVLAARAGQSRVGWLKRTMDQLTPATVCGVVLIDA
jgi:Mrp family chromosome partitioning ATPase